MNELQEAFQNYHRFLKFQKENWVVADNPVKGRDEKFDAELQRKRLEAVFYTIKTGEEISEYKDMIEGMPDDPIERMAYKFENYITALKAAVAEKLTAEQLRKFSEIVIGFLPTGRTNAMAVVKSISGEKLQGGLIFLNEGLYFSAGFAAKAIVLANMRDEHEHLRAGAKPALTKGVEFYLNPHPSNAENEFHSTGNPYEEGEISTHISSVKEMMLQFVVLHELGHIILNHHDYINRNRLSLMGDEQWDSLSDEEKESLHQIEYEADLFAFERIEENSSSNQSRLANLYAIGTLFVFLECVERKIQTSLSKTHPAPLDRLRKLSDSLNIKLKNQLNFDSLFDELSKLCDEWSEI